MFALVPVWESVSVAVTVWTVPAVVLVVNDTVAVPLALVVLVGELKDPPFVLLQVTTLPVVWTGLPPESANCAVIVTDVPATGLKLLDATTYFEAAPELKVAVTVKLLLFMLNWHVVLVVVQVPAVMLLAPLDPVGTFQPPNVAGAVGVSVRVTVALFAKPLSEQVPEDAPEVLVQLILPGLLVTEPVPVPAKATVKVLLSVNVVCAWETAPTAVRVK